MIVDDRRRGWALAAFGMLMVSTDSVFIRAADFDSWTIAFVFGLTSTISLGIVSRITSSEPPARALRRAPGPLLAVAALSSTTQISFTAAVNHTRVANVVVIVAAAPILAVVLARLVLREHTERRVMVAIGLTAVGVVVVVSGSVGAPTLDGDLFALLAIAAFSASVVVWRRHPEIDRPLALAVGSAMMALVTAPFASIGEAPVRVFVAAGLMGLVVNPIGRISYTSAPRYAPAAEVALFTPIETVAASAWAWIFFSERPPLPTVVGGMVVIVAVLHGTVGRGRSSFTDPPAGPRRAAGRPGRNGPPPRPTR